MNQILCFLTYLFIKTPNEKHSKMSIEEKFLSIETSLASVEPICTLIERNPQQVASLENTGSIETVYGCLSLFLVCEIDIGWTW